MYDAASNHNCIIPGKRQARNEPELRLAIIRVLQASGVVVEEQVICAAGTADIVTTRRDAVIEVKLELTRKAIQWAVGQVLLYRAAINPYARAIIIGYATPETATLINWASAVGVEIMCWKDESERLKSEMAVSALTHPPFRLRWNVQALARSHGITRVVDLAQFLNLPRQSLYGIWRGTAVNISVSRLERLVKRLGPAPEEWLYPGDWFRFENDRLIWNIRVVAEQVGLNATQLGFAASQYPQQIALFWNGTAKFVFVDTLARLAAALETEARIFDVGQMFIKSED